MTVNKHPIGMLARIAAHKKTEVAERQRNHPLARWMEMVSPCETSGQLEVAFRRTDVSTRLMLEIKPSSPSMGVMQVQPDLDTLLRAYNRYGVAISVLTDARFFGGSLALLERVRQNTSLPVLCKDFILDSYQVCEARRVGAEAVLLIVKMLEDAVLLELTERILALGMTPLIEIQNEAELARALTLSPTILLINNRNLDTLDVDPDTTVRLADRIPPGILRVSASGFGTRDQIDRLRPYCDGFLIGSALMTQAPDQLPEKLREFTG